MGVTDQDDPLTAAVEATIAKIRFKEQVLDRRARAVHQMRASGMSVAAISRALFDALRERGISDEDIEGSGIGPDSVKRILERPAP
jgi:hypothetical protein